MIRHVDGRVQADVKINSSWQIRLLGPAVLFRFYLLMLSAVCYLLIISAAGYVALMTTNVLFHRHSLADLCDAAWRKNHALHNTQDDIIEG